MKRSMKEEIHPTFPESSQCCIECVKGILTKTKRKLSTRSSDILEITHTDICGHFPTVTLSAFKYCISFTLMTFLGMFMFVRLLIKLL